MNKINILTLSGLIIATPDLLGDPVQVNFKKIDETGDSSIAIAHSRKIGKNYYTIRKDQRKFEFITDTSFEYAFLAGASDETFVWLAPCPKPGKIICAFISLTDKISYEINLEKIVKKYCLCPMTISRSDGQAFEYWNINEWSNSEIGIGVNCRLNPYDESKGFLIFNYKKKCVTFIDLTGSGLGEVDYPLDAGDVDVIIKKLE